MFVVAIIQARIGSTRLPGKVVKDIGGETMLARVIRRVQRASLLGDLVVATTTSRAEEPIVGECRRLGVSVFRGSESDVLDRYYQAALVHKAEVVVRITSDCPLIDPKIVDMVAEGFLKSRSADYASNTLPPRTFPRGLDVEVMSMAALERAWQEDDNPAWREHVTPYVYRHPEKFSLHPVTNAVDYSYMRWTVDTAEDLDLVRRIYEHFGHDRFSWWDVLGAIEANPEYLEVNKDVVQQEVL